MLLFNSQLSYFNPFIYYLLIYLDLLFFGFLYVSIIGTLMHIFHSSPSLLRHIYISFISIMHYSSVSFIHINLSFLYACHSLSLQYITLLLSLLYICS